MLVATKMEDQIVLHCSNCGSSDSTPRPMSLGANRREIGDGIHVISLVVIRCHQCDHHTSYGVCDMGGVTQILSLDYVTGGGNGRPEDTRSRQSNRR